MAILGSDRLHGVQLLLCADPKGLEAGAALAFRVGKLAQIQANIDVVANAVAEELRVRCPLCLSLGDIQRLITCELLVQHGCCCVRHCRNAMEPILEQLACGAARDLRNCFLDECLC